MFRCLKHMTSEDSLKKPRWLAQKKKSFMRELIAAFNCVKRITEKIESNFSHRCTEKEQEAMTRKKTQLDRSRGVGGNHKVSGYRPEEGPREAVKSVSLETFSRIGP